MPESVPTVVVVGAGFGGITLVRRLHREPLRIVLVDQNNFHLFTPLLYEVGSALLDPSEIAYPTRAILRRYHNVEFRMAHIDAIDLAGRRLQTPEGTIPYDYLVIAAGSVTNFFGNAELATEAFGLKDLGDALALRNRVLAQFEQASWIQDESARRKLLSFVVVGGGPTGVEFAGALSELINLVLRKDFRELDVRQAQITLVEGAGSVLAGYHPSLQAAAARTLERKGIRLIFNAMVAGLRHGQVLLQDGRELEAGTVIWTAGVRGGDLGRQLGLPLGRGGRVPVEPTLQLAAHPEVFIIGDLAEVRQGGTLLPQVIPVAMQEAACVAFNLRALRRGEPLRPFRYRDPGSMATIGRNAGVVQLRGLRFSGFIGWVMWLVFHLLQVISLRNRLIVLINWAKDYFFYDRPVRLIARAAGPARSEPLPVGAGRPGPSPPPRS
jgi:NADH dehydrogenase